MKYNQAPLKKNKYLFPTSSEVGNRSDPYSLESQPQNKQGMKSFEAMSKFNFFSKTRGDIFLSKMFTENSFKIASTQIY